MADALTTWPRPPAVWVPVPGEALAGILERRGVYLSEAGPMPALLLRIAGRAHLAILLGNRALLEAFERTAAQLGCRGTVWYRGRDGSGRPRWDVTVSGRAELPAGCRGLEGA